MNNLVFTTYIKVPEEPSVNQKPYVIHPLIAPPTPDCTTALWGTKTAVAVLRTVRRQALKQSYDICSVSLLVEERPRPITNIRLQDLPDINFINLSRASVGLRDKIASVLGIAEFRGQHLGSDPYQLNALWQHPDFAHIQAYAWKAELAVGGKKVKTQLAAIRKQAIAEIIVRSTDDIQAVLD